MSRRLALVTLFAIAACGGSDEPTESESIIESLSTATSTGDDCDEVWVEGADMDAIADASCLVDGEPTFFWSASIDCPNGDKINANDFGYWLDSEMVLHTDGTSAEWPTPEQASCA